MNSKIIGFRVNQADIDNINTIRINIDNNHNAIADTSTAVRIAIGELSRLINQGHWPHKAEAH